MISMGHWSPLVRAKIAYFGVQAWNFSQSQGAYGKQYQGVLANQDGDGEDNVAKQILMSRTMTMHVHFESWYIFSLLSSAKQQREMTKIYVC